MRYSEIKPLIKQLHENHWMKVPGQPYYRKIWTKWYDFEELQYGRHLALAEVLCSSVPLSKVLEYCEHEVKQEFENFIKRKERDREKI